MGDRCFIRVTGFGWVFGRADILHLLVFTWYYSHAMPIYVCDLYIVLGSRIEYHLVTQNSFLFPRTDLRVSRDPLHRHCPPIPSALRDDCLGLRYRRQVLSLHFEEVENSKEQPPLADRDEMPFPSTYVPITTRCLRRLFGLPSMSCAPRFRRVSLFGLQTIKPCASPLSGAGPEE